MYGERSQSCSTFALLGGVSLFLVLQVQIATVTGMSLDRLGVDRNEILNEKQNSEDYNGVGTAEVVDERELAAVPAVGHTDAYVLLPPGIVSDIDNVNKNTIENAHVEEPMNMVEEGGDMVMMESNDAPIMQMIQMPALEVDEDSPKVKPIEHQQHLEPVSEIDEPEQEQDQESEMEMEEQEKEEIVAAAPALDESIDHLSLHAEDADNTAAELTSNELSEETAALGSSNSDSETINDSALNAESENASDIRAEEPKLDNESAFGVFPNVVEAAENSEQSAVPENDAEIEEDNSMVNKEELINANDAVEEGGNVEQQLTVDTPVVPEQVMETEGHQNLAVANEETNDAAIKPQAEIENMENMSALLMEDADDGVLKDEQSSNQEPEMVQIENDNKAEVDEHNSDAIESLEMPNPEKIEAVQEQQAAADEEPAIELAGSDDEVNNAMLEENAEETQGNQGEVQSEEKENVLEPQDALIEEEKVQELPINEPETQETVMEEEKLQEVPLNPEVVKEETENEVVESQGEENTNTVEGNLNENNEAEKTEEEGEEKDEILIATEDNNKEVYEEETIKEHEELESTVEQEQDREPEKQIELEPIASELQADISEEVLQLDEEMQKVEQEKTESNESIPEPSADVPSEDNKEEQAQQMETMEQLQVDPSQQAANAQPEEEEQQKPEPQMELKPEPESEPETEPASEPELEQAPDVIKEQILELGDDLKEHIQTIRDDMAQSEVIPETEDILTPEVESNESELPKADISVDAADKIDNEDEQALALAMDEIENATTGQENMQQTADDDEEIAEKEQEPAPQSILTTIVQVPPQVTIQAPQPPEQENPAPVAAAVADKLTESISNEQVPAEPLQDPVQVPIESSTQRPIDVADSVLNYVNASLMQQQQQPNSETNNKAAAPSKPQQNDEEQYSAQLRRYDGAQVWRIVVQTDRDRKLADELQTKYDGQLWKEVKQEVDYLLRPQVLRAAEQHIRAANLSRIVLIDNLQKVIEVENPPAEEIAQLQNRKGHRLTWQAYHRLADIHDFFDYMAKTYPDICSVETIGYSIQKRALKILKISNGNANNPGIWIDGGMHAREWISPAAVTYIANQLIEGWDDLPEFMRNINWHIHAVANPDGYEYSHTTDRLWRKNMRSHGRQCPGVDLNRNFGYKWGGKGTSANPCSQTYRGNKAFSEPETFYISKYISGLPRNTFQAYLTFHSYGQYILYPWGYDYALTSDRADLDRVARQAGTTITKSSGGKYTVGSSALTLYPAAGGSDDWAKGFAGIKYSYTIEMGDTGRYGFVLPADQIEINGKDGFTFVEAVARAVTKPNEARRRAF